MDQKTKKIGTVRIAPGVLVTIVSSAALGVTGVLRMGAAGSFSRRIFGRDDSGVKIEVKDGKVFADLYVIVDKTASISEIGKQVQSDVSNAIRHIVGMPVEQVNVHIQNVE